METNDEALLSELRSPEPNYDVLRNIFNSNRDLVAQVLNDSNYGTSLHIAAKSDTRNGTYLTQFLLTEYNANPNIKNNGDSIPLYWALSELNSCDNPSLNGINSLINHPRFSLSKRSLLRKSVLEFVLDFYSKSRRGDLIVSIIKDKIWKDRLLVLLLQKEIKNNFYEI